MSMTLNDEAIEELQKKYDYLINYDSSDSSDPIGPLTYVDSNGDNLMHIAAQLGDVETIILLADAGMNINQKGDMGSTALHYAYDGKHSRVVESLLARGASTEIKNEFGRLPGE
ncbi:ankyrin repeat domain-containing protein [Collimonas sp. NPDC087041]|uniref:ankyrin repeat domain-containing protein n=1 Tax=Collimonas sp. NPDC087041 TaxID=3363960 RepID=UPI0037F84D39